MSGLLSSIASAAADALSGLLPARGAGEASRPGAPEAGQSGGFSALLAAALGPAAPRTASAESGEAPEESRGEGETAGEGESAPETRTGGAAKDPARWSGSHGLRAADLAASSSWRRVREGEGRTGEEQPGEASPAAHPSMAAAVAGLPATAAPRPAAAETEEASATAAEETAPAGETRRSDRPRRARGAGADHVHRDPGMLDPEFRIRLERVVERMRGEFGHEVRLTETFREQERQEHLFAQGRTRPGPVVTWTRNSNHTDGRAADVIIDGTYDNPAGYARLTRIAREEGLRTLGARDPGHLELPRGAGTPGFEPSLAAADRAYSGEGSASTRRAAWAPPSPAPGVARVAEVARVAGVAQVAQVAAVARVAAPGGTQGAGAPTSGVRVRSAEARVERAEAADAAPAPAAQKGESTVSAPLPVRPAAEVVADPRRPAPEEREVSAAASEAPQRSDADPAGLRPHAPARDAAPGGAVGAAAPVRGADAASRVARALEVRDGAAARPLSSITLRVDDGQGGEDRIRVDLRGNAVDATLDVKGAGEAERLNARVGELQQALERQGLEAESVRIRAGQAADGGDSARAAAALREGDGLRTAASRTDSSSTPQRDRSGSTFQDEPRRDSEDPRQRSRREQKGGSQP